MRVEGAPGHPLIFMAFHNLILNTWNFKLNIKYLIPDSHLRTPHI